MVILDAERLYNLIKQSDTTIDELKAKDYRIAQALRIEEIIRDATIVKKWTPRKTVRGLKRQKYVETESRLKMIRGNHDASKYILSCLRNGDNVEFTGPTGTGKTQIAIYAAKLFCDGREPVVLSGGPGVYASTFYGSAAGQGKRNPGTAIQAIENDTVLIIDEDNRIDPKQLAEIKFLLGLKPGDLFFHRDTGQMYTIPPHFRVIVTRNEKGAHHKDRSELPADYRREFTFGSFEVPYYTPQEMYDRFLIPKLARKDGSMDLSIDEVGGKIGTDQTSPLLELVLAAEEIQKEYKSVHLKNSVFESGYLIGLFNQWKEVKYAKDKQGARIKFLTYIEAKLLEFIKRAGLGNPDRKILIQILYRHGFFHGWKREVFQTEDEGLVYVNDADFTSLTTSVTKDIFANARLEITTQKHLEPSEVAMLDPFNKRDIQITEHPLKSKIEEFYNKYVEFCEGQKPRVFPVVFTPDDDFESKKVRITNQLIEQMELKQTTVLWLHVADLINTLKDAQAASLEELLEAATQLIVGFNDRLAALATIYKESRTYTSKYKDYERQVLALTRDTSLPALTPATFRRPSDFISDIANALNDLIPYIERYGHKYEAMPRQDPALKNVAKVDLIKFNKIPEILKDPARAINLQHFKDILDGTSGFARLIFDLNKNKFKQ
ncbi:MAG: hypothetical protein UR28_C0014G0004 [Candidatus Peregrinibacteria bacterium GW2011_GWF2_33_10]|nr:MAG: hypothetical protein UR28_C0014G0004 [Candidatus Peregrinibacteria bacterium GW2011_GWF2_33_10]